MDYPYVGVIVYPRLITAEAWHVCVFLRITNPDYVFLFLGTCGGNHDAMMNMFGMRL